MKVFGTDVHWEVPDHAALRVGEIDLLDVPQDRLEEWRYSPIDTFRIEDFAQSPVSVSAAQQVELRQELAALAEIPNWLMIAGGRLVDYLITSSDVTLATSSAESLFDFDPSEPFRTLGSLLAPSMIEVRMRGDGARIGIVQVGGGAGTASFTSLRVVVEDDSVAEVVELQKGYGQEFSVPLINFSVGAHARCSYRVTYDRQATDIAFGELSFQVQESGHFHAAHVGVGFGYSRLRTDGALMGAEARTRIRAGYVTGSEEIAEFRTFVRHEAPRTQSDLLYKGAIVGSGSSIYTGLITITPNGGGSNAFQTNRNILLSSSARAESVPNLDIETSDVRCSHASTVGPLEEDLIFYLQSKGIPRGEAKRILADAFFSAMHEDLSEHERTILRRALHERWEDDGNDYR
ncbi:MAG: SufD family Fe-S cluster assembly protein [Ferrimicrobium sp.]